MSSFCSFPFPSLISLSSLFLQVEQVALRLGEDVSSLKEKWSKLTAKLEETQSTITDLTGRELFLTTRNGPN